MARHNDAGSSTWVAVAVKEDDVGGLRCTSIYVSRNIYLRTAPSFLVLLTRCCTCRYELCSEYVAGTAFLLAHFQVSVSLHGQKRWEVLLLYHVSICPHPLHRLQARSGVLPSGASRRRDTEAQRAKVGITEEQCVVDNNIASHFIQITQPRTLGSYE